MQEILQKLQEHDKRFDQMDNQIDFIVKKVLEHDERLDKIDEKLEQVSTKEDISRITNTLDKIVKLYETKDQELMLISRGLRDVEDQVKINTKDMQKMKPALGLS